MPLNRLDHEITIQSQENVSDGEGGFSTTWTDEAVIWAGREDKSGREFRAAGTLNAETSTLFKIRYRTDLLPTMRIKWGSIVFQIVEILHYGRRGSWLLVGCKDSGERIAVGAGGFSEGFSDGFG